MPTLQSAFGLFHPSGVGKWGPASSGKENVCHTWVP